MMKVDVPNVNNVVNKDAANALSVRKSRGYYYSTTSQPTTCNRRKKRILSPRSCKGEVSNNGNVNLAIMLPFKLSTNYICLDYNIQTQKDVKNSDEVEALQSRAVDAKDLIAKSENGNCETHLMGSAENLMSVLMFTKVGNLIEEPIPVKGDVKSSHDVIAKARLEFVALEDRTVAKIQCSERSQDNRFCRQQLNSNTKSVNKKKQDVTTQTENMRVTCVVSLRISAILFH